MKSRFIKLDSIEETHDGSVIINASNISTIRLINYNDTVQTMIQMVGGERFGVQQLPEDILDLINNAQHEAVA